MACYRPLTAYRSRTINASGKRSLVFTPSEGFKDMKVEIACGQCIGCRLERSRQWAVRCIHEASLHDDNCFITLTYAPEHLPEGNTLVLEHFQKFMKRLRKKVGAVRFFHCGEYGEKEGRPHYHAIIFGYDFPDQRLYSDRNGTKLYTSELLGKLWPFGFSTVGAVTFDSAAYVARYIMKKVTGDVAALHYSDIDYNTGEIISTRKPEYVTMSRRPGIAAGWFDKYGSDVFPHDRVIVKGKEMKPPKFYDSRYEILDPKGMESIKRKRGNKALKRADNNSAERLAVREKVKMSQISRLVRTLD